MNILQSTQFAHVSPNTKGLPSFLAKKLEQAIVDSYLKQNRDLKKAQEEKLLKAQMRRDEQMSIKAVKLMVHSDKVRDAQVKKSEIKKAREEIYQDILATKMKLADLKAEEMRLKKIAKAERQAKKLEQAQKNKEEIEAQKSQKMSEQNKSEFKVRLVYQIKEKNQKRNYEILKNLQRKRFDSVFQRKQKAESLSEKLKKAEERREQILKRKVEKAITMACGNTSPSEDVQQVLLNTTKTVVASHPVEIVHEHIKPTESRANSQTKIEKDSTENDSDEGFEVVDEVDQEKQRKLQEKLAKAEANYQRMLEKKTNKAKDSYTKFGPTKEQVKKLMAERRKTTFRGNRCRHTPTKFKKANESFFIPSDTDNSDKYVFVQHSKDKKAIETTKNMKNIKAKPQAISFEIDRVVTSKGCNTARTTTGSQTEHV